MPGLVQAQWLGRGEGVVRVLGKIIEDVFMEEY